jgi:DNA-binding NtrC family response regulator
MDTLMNYPWPGNVRELQNVLYRFVTLKRLDLTGGSLPIQPAIDVAAAEPPPLTPLADGVKNLEKRLITATLAEHRWNRTRAAQALGIGLRTLQRKMKAYGIQ